MGNKGVVTPIEKESSKMKKLLLLLTLVLMGSGNAQAQWRVCEPFPKNEAEYKARLQAVAAFLNEAHAIKARQSQRDAKDAQQQAKDKQQQDKDKQQVDTDAFQVKREKSLNALQAQLAALEKSLNERSQCVSEVSFKCPRPCCNGSDSKPPTTCHNAEKPADKPVTESKRIDKPVEPICPKPGDLTKPGSWKKHSEKYQEWAKERKKYLKALTEYYDNKTKCDHQDQLKAHINRSGGGDGTNPGAGGNIDGFDNPGNANHVEKGKDDKATGIAVAAK